MKRTVLALVLVAIFVSLMTACGRERENTGPTEYDKGKANALVQINEALKACREYDDAKAKLKAMPLTSEEDIKARDKVYSDLQFRKTRIKQNSYTENLEQCQNARGLDTDLLPQPPSSATPPPSSSSPLRVFPTYDSNTKS